MIKAIIFDFYGVIYSDDLWGYVFEHGELQTDSDDVNTGRTSWEEFRAAIANKMNISLSDVDEMYHRNKINRQLVGLIVELSKNYKIGLLTDANRAHIEPLLNEIGVNELFDVVAVSSDIGITKPNPKAYQNVSKKLGLAEESVLFVDDLKRNTDGAEDVGMKSLLYQDFESFSKELKVLLAQ